MTEPAISRPPRLVPDRPFPPYAYLPGRSPHPTRDPDGHSFGKTLETPDPPDPEDWRGCGDYLYGIDLFNGGYFWEAHEAWEGLWVACGRRGPTAAYLQGLINLAAAGFKARWGNARGMRANAGTAARLLETAVRQLCTPKPGGPQLASGGGRFMGLDVRALAAQAGRLARVGDQGVGDEGVAAFDLVLRPE